MPKGVRACQSEGAQARMSTCMPNEERTCPREHAHDKRRAHKPKGARRCETEGAEAEGGRAHVKCRAHMPKGGRT
jgi:hypothetical protein